MADEIIGICVVCNQKIIEKAMAKRVDGLWLCSEDCISRFLKEKKKWSPENWGELCKLQALYEERKRKEIESLLT